MFSLASQRNRAPILGQLRPSLLGARKVLEIASEDSEGEDRHQSTLKRNIPEKSPVT